MVARMNKNLLNSGVTALAIVAIASPSSARLTRINIESSTPAKDGYEVLRGTFEGEVDPKDMKNKVIVDLDKAPRNVRGNVEYSASLIIYRPTDPAKASGVLR